jgi:alpha-amylase/alpha-mannosidase (GH57 family)
MERYVCIHCHFYQPPRENPWLEAVELQDSAYPYHDWNERITAECYAPNAASRILDGQGRIAQIVNNYQRISFNFGPTLLSWMEDNAPETYGAILQADRESHARYSGHGSAMAQAYNHMILPLSSRRDRETQIKWGIRDFQYRFGRDAEGMWLPETAVDVETLEILADNGIRFTVLAPHQAAHVRRKRARGAWHSVEGAKIDPTRAYVCKLPDGREIALFFYDGPISRAVAFERLLSSGEDFANRLLSGFSDTRKWGQLMHIATDGETYGHHHPHGDMALAYALHYIESNNLAKLTNYGEYLAGHPPQVEVQIVNNTSWSCPHGLERWKSDCGCNSGGNGGWKQAWREPLRNALDWLRDAMAEPYENAARELLNDPWGARNDYIDVVLRRSADSLVNFFQKHETHVLTNDEVTRALKLLEIQRHLMLMYTSCGWFFDELSGIETVQVISYAGRAIQLAQELFGDHIEEQFLERLAHAQSNLPTHADGMTIYRKWVKPATVDLLGVGAHYAISSLFEHNHDGEQDYIYCYDVSTQNYIEREFGRSRLALGRVRIRSSVTFESADITFGVLHLGDHNLTAAVRPFHGEEAYSNTAKEIQDAFGTGDISVTIRQLDRHFQGTTYSLKSLFRDEQRRIINEIMQTVLGDATSSYRHVYELHAPLMRFLGELHMPLPNVLRLTAEFVINASLREALLDEPVDVQRVRALLDAATREAVSLDAAGLGFTLKNRLVQMSDALLRNPTDLRELQRMVALVQLARTLPFEVNLWKPQNNFYAMMNTILPEIEAQTDEYSREWVTQFRTLGEALNVSVPMRTATVPLAA